MTEELCPGCGGVVFDGEAFCEACGRPLTAPPPGDAPHTADAGRPAAGAPRPHGGAPPPGTEVPPPASTTPPGTEVPPPGAVPGDACAACGHVAAGADGYCERCGTLRPGDRDHVEIETGGAAGVSDRGLRHARNEDALALAAAGSGIAAVVSDGVSVSPLPQEASRAAADIGLAALAERLAAGDDPDTATRLALARAADAVAALAASPADAPACTYVSAYAAGGSITVGWVGDSRAYWLAGAASRLLTTDDSWAAAMVARGALTEDAAAVHPNAHALIAWLGADAGEITPHVTTFTLDGPGTLLLCSDGLWNYHPDATRLAELMPAGDPLTAARHLVRLALDSGGRDNVTVVVVPLTQEHAS